MDKERGFGNIKWAKKRFYGHWRTVWSWELKNHIFQKKESKFALTKNS